MSCVVTDDTPTSSVVWMAAEQIGKTQNHNQLQKICDYLVNKHWFQTAGDLRSARRETTEWQALEVPGRLKLAIQHVLDQTTDSMSSYGYEEYYAAVRPSLTPESESEADTQQWMEAANEYATTEGGQGTTDYYSGGYTYPSSETMSTTAGQYNYDQGYAANPPSYDETYGGEYEAYYNASTASNYQETGAAATLLSLQGSCGHSNSPVNENGVVEAHAVEVVVAEEIVESELVNTQAAQTEAVEHGEPSQRELSDLNGNWSCGQCTFLNSMTSSFCEMCVGHISLSPDIKTAAGTSVSASLLIPAKPVVEVAMNAPHSEPSITLYSPQSPPTVTCMLPRVGSLYPPSAPDFDPDIQEDNANSTPRPSPPPYPGTSSCGNIDFLALAFSGSSAPKTEASGPLPIPKSSQMRREEATTITEYTF